MNSATCVMNLGLGFSGDNKYCTKAAWTGNRAIHFSRQAWVDLTRVAGQGPRTGLHMTYSDRLTARGTTDRKKP